MHRWIPRPVTLVFVGALLGACGGKETSAPPVKPYVPPTRPSLAQTYRPTGRGAAGDVAVHLFDWKWTSIASECETVLGPAGYAAVQVSPPNEHSITPSHDWSERYQPVSYSVERSRSGTGAEFVSMVARCRAAGVDVYVDAVVDHMTNFPSPGVGSAGTHYSKYEYPGLYTQSDFHAPCTVSNYQSAANVQDCELYGLPDLNTGSPSVRQKIADYLVSLARLGIAGFRIDAAKHIQPVELDAILSLVNRALAAEGRPIPWYFAEVTDYGGEAVRASDYYGLAFSSGGTSDITEFRFRGIGDKFLPRGAQKLADHGANAIAFSRGDRGFVAINRESAPISVTLSTGLAAGSYCDLLTGGRSGGSCAGPSLTVDATGVTRLTVPANSALAVDVATRL